MDPLGDLLRIVPSLSYWYSASVHSWSSTGCMAWTLISSSLGSSGLLLCCCSSVVPLVPAFAWSGIVLRVSLCSPEVGCPSIAVTWSLLSMRLGLMDFLVISCPVRLHMDMFKVAVYSGLDTYPCNRNSWNRTYCFALPIWTFCYCG